MDGTSGGTIKAIAFVAENKRPKAGRKFADGIVVIDWLEAGRTQLHARSRSGDDADLEDKPAPMPAP